MWVACLKRRPLEVLLFSFYGCLLPRVKLNSGKNTNGSFEMWTPYSCDSVWLRNLHSSYTLGYSGLMNSLCNLPDVLESFLFYYGESRNREVKTRLIYEDRCDERLKNKSWGIYTPRIHWVESFLLSYILRYVSLVELGNVCQEGFREPMHLCTCVSEEEGDGEVAGSEAPSLF
jgi:hypothetical protein